MGSRSVLSLFLVVFVLAIGAVLFFVLVGDPEAGDAGLEVAHGPAPGDSRPAAELRGGGEGGAAAENPAARSVVSTGSDRGPNAAGARDLGPRVRGRVIDKFGNGVSGATVIVGGAGFLSFPLESIGDGDGTAENRWTAVTADDGTFALQGPGPGSVQVAVRCPGYAPYLRRDLPLPAGEAVQLEPFTISLGAILTGRVVDPHGVGVAGARLSRELESSGLWSFPGRRTLLARTDGQGLFRIDELPCGAWKIVVESDEYPDRVFDGLAETPGREYGPLELRLEAGERIRGLARGVPAEESEKLEVRAMRQGTDPFGFGSRDVRHADVAADGSFVVAGARQGETYDLRLQTKRTDEFAWGWNERARSEVVSAAAGDAGVELVYHPESALLFRVLDAETGAPLTDFRVEGGIRWPLPLRGEDGKPLLHHPDGRVRFAGLRPTAPDDRVDFTVVAAGYEHHQQKGIELGLGEERDLGEIRLAPVPVLRVTVRDAKNRAPVAGARVVLEKAPEPLESGMHRISMNVGDGGDTEEVHPFDEGVHRGETDEEGVAVLTSLPGTTCLLRVTAKGHARYERADLELPAEGDAEVEVLLAAGGRVLVRVVDPDGEPLVGVKVGHRPPSTGGNMVFQIGGGAREITDTEGMALFEHLSTGLHSFRIATDSGGGLVSLGMAGSIAISGASADLAEEGWEKVEVVEGTTAELTLLGEPRGVLLGSVREAGVPLAGATVRVEKKRSSGGGGAGLPMLIGGFGGGPSARTDGDGHYQLPNLEAGEYTVTVTHPTRHMADTFEAEVTEGKNRFDIDLAVSILEGRITDQDGEPLAGLRVSARRARPEDGPSTQVRTRMVMVAGDGDSNVVSFGDGPALSENATTDAEGRYQLRGVAADVELQVEATGDFVQQGRSDPVTVAPGEVKSGVDFSLDAAGRMRIQAVRGDGSPMEFVQVTARYAGDAAEDIEPVVEFIQGGSGVLDGLRPGPWIVSSRPLGPDDQASAPEREVEVESGREVPVTLQFD